jgi:hypothetical protein
VIHLNYFRQELLTLKEQIRWLIQDLKHGTDLIQLAVDDAVRRSLESYSIGKMIQTGTGKVTITGDSASILKQMSVIHPILLKDFFC